MRTENLGKETAERVIAESIAAIQPGTTCEQFACETVPGSSEPRPAVCTVDGIHFCAKHAPTDSRFGLALLLRGAMTKPSVTSEVAYLRSKEWTLYDADAAPGGAWVRPSGKGAQVSLACAVDEQRAADAVNPVTIEQALASAVHWATMAGTLALEQNRDVVAQSIAVAASGLRRALAKVQREKPRAPFVDAEGVCDECEKMPEGQDGRAAFCSWHQSHPTEPTVKP